MPMRLICPPDEPFSLTMKDCRIVGRAGFEETDLIVGENVRRVTLTRVRLERLCDPKILCDPTAEVLVTE